MKKSLFCLFYCTILSIAGFCQKEGTAGNDTFFYRTYPKLVTGRFYFSQKYTDFQLNGLDRVANLHYKPNTTLNMGIGVTYHNISLNIAYGFGFLNKDEAKGTTKYLDLQGHAYLPKWVVNWYGQFYKGYYLSPGVADPGMTAYYHRPDAHVTLVGTSVYRLLNGNRFSYRASMLQNEWQTRSAGSLLIAPDLYYGKMKADSSWVPGGVDKNNAYIGLNQISFLSVGPGIGYAYTFVAHQHYFLMGSLVLNLNANFAKEADGTSIASLEPGYGLTIATGYNSNNWNISANWVEGKLWVRGSAANKYILSTGNYRINVAKRIFPSPHVKTKLNIIDRVLD